jgi:hypothetical protein
MGVLDWGQLLFFKDLQEWLIVLSLRANSIRGTSDRGADDSKKSALSTAVSVKKPQTHRCASPQF